MRCLLALAISLALAGPAFAAAPRPAPAPRAIPADEAAARAEIERLTARIEELADQLGDGERVRVIHHRELAPKERIRIERALGAAPGQPLRIEGLPAPQVGIGVVLGANTATSGVKLAAVTPGGPAAKAGLRSGDVLLSVDGKRIAGSGDDAMGSARALLKGLKKDQKLRLGYVRAGKAGEATVVAGDITHALVMSRLPGDTQRLIDRHVDRNIDRQVMRVVEPRIEGELRRLLPLAECDDGDEACTAPALLEAFRWQGLNLAAIDADLGKYFGTDDGVLVVSRAPGFEGLRSGDVVQRVGGKPVDTPRDVMRALRAGEVGASVPVVVLRERKPVTVTIVVPRAQALPFLRAVPPVPPVPPVAPVAPVPPVPPVPPSRRPHAAPPALPAPPAHAAPPAPPAAPPPPPDDDAAVMTAPAPAFVA